MDNSLEGKAGSPPGGPPGGVEEWRAVSRVLKSPGFVVRAVFDDLITTFFPGDCSACGGPLLKAGSSPVCDECIDGLRAQLATLCVRCGEALDIDGLHYEKQFGAEALLCSPCRLAPPQFERAAAWGLYEDRMRELIHMLKYEGVRAAAKPLGKLLEKVIVSMGEGPSMGRELVVIAVPLFPVKQRQRGYNQSVLIVDEALAELWRDARWKLETAHGALRRVRDTESQFGLTASGRRRNLRGAFVVADPAVISGREVLLVDDIYTTGATARECARVLRQAGAAKVWVATVARAQREMVAGWDAQTNVAAWDAGWNRDVQS
jgi:ComF family protein